MPKPKWLTDMSKAKRIQVLTQAHAIIIDECAETEYITALNSRDCVNFIWMIKSHLEQEAKKE